MQPRLQHVSVPRPSRPETREQAVRFYRDVLGCEEIPTPSSFGAESSTLWFRCGDGEIHVYVVEGPIRVEGHFCLVVEDTAAMRDRLEDAGCACQDADPIPNRPRFYTHDPFGNRIEVTSIEGDYREG